MRQKLAFASCFSNKPLSLLKLQINAHFFDKERERKQISKSNALLKMICADEKKFFFVLFKYISNPLKWVFMYFDLSKKAKNMSLQMQRNGKLCELLDNIFY